MATSCTPPHIQQNVRLPVTMAVEEEMRFYDDAACIVVLYLSSGNYRSS